MNRLQFLLIGQLTCFQSLSVSGYPVCEPWSAIAPEVSLGCQCVTGWLRREATTAASLKVVDRSTYSYCDKRHTEVTGDATFQGSDRVVGIVLSDYLRPPAITLKESLSMASTFLAPYIFIDRVPSHEPILLFDRSAPERINMRKAIRRFLEDESGPTAVEYAVMLALIVGVCIGSVTLLANGTRGSFDSSANAISAAM